MFFCLAISCSKLSTVPSSSSIWSFNLLICSSFAFKRSFSSSLVASLPAVFVSLFIIEETPGMFDALSFAQLATSTPAIARTTTVIVRATANGMTIAKKNQRMGFIFVFSSWFCLAIQITYSCSLSIAGSKFRPSLLFPLF
ncbi:DUF3147 family protein [Aciduricibacillus chroicocephali]|uniref:DUF3147 family protein n=1 Tax=Aciduricibacillus chroicocephali TaxID=3054939 RepID=UPI003D659E92